MPPHHTKTSPAAKTAVLGAALLSALVLSACAADSRIRAEHSRPLGDHRPDIADGVTVYGTISGSISHIHR